jgi:predicted ATPase/class 3 adenylate cyclase/Flp pilus assembly protein TadD
MFTTVDSVLMATDIVDSTRITEELGDAAVAELWSSHDRVARDLLASHGAREIDSADGFLLLFSTVSGALDYAREYHSALARLSVPVRARVGIHVGAVTHRANSAADIARGAKSMEIDGRGVPIVARTMSVANGGQTLLTAQARAALGPTASGLQSCGFWRMKGLDEPIELFEAQDDEVSIGPPRASDKVHPVVRRGDLWLPLAKVQHSLPAERDKFIGRRQPLRALRRRYEDGARLVTVLGAGGSGKTRLVQRFGWASLADFPGGVWFCDASEAQSLDGVIHSVAQGIELPLRDEDPANQIAGAIAARGRCLVIIDNFEQVTAFAEMTVGRWLDQAPEACIAVTSRELLGIRGEERFVLEPLPTSEAAELFIERASGHAHDFKPTNDDIAAIDRIARLVDGLPLALELAAARVRLMAPPILAQRMNERFKTLGTAKGRARRQVTLRAAFDWSWDLLHPAERTALAQLSVFEGGFSLAAAEAVLDVSTLEKAWPALDLVGSLVDKSWVREANGRRFSLLATIREYAEERLNECGVDAAESVRRRHWTYFAGLDEVDCVANRCIETDNLIAACRRATAANDLSNAVNALVGAWAALRLSGPFRTAVELAEAVQENTCLEPGHRAIAHWVTGCALHELGRVGDSLARFRQGLESSSMSKDVHVEGRLLCAVSDPLMDAGRIDEARQCLEAALVQSRSEHDRRLECDALNRLGVLHDHCADFEQARLSFAKALTIARSLSDPHRECGVVGNLGTISRNLGELDDARGYFERSLALAIDIGDRRWEGSARCNLGLLHYDQGRMAEARSELEAALKVAHDLGHFRLEATVLCNLGIVIEGQGDLMAAAARYEQAVAAAQGLNDQRSEGQFRGYLGAAYGRLGRVREARKCLTQGQALLEGVSDSLSLALLFCSRAHVETLAGRQGAAVRWLARARALGHKMLAGPESELGREVRKLERMLADQVVSGRA